MGDRQSSSAGCAASAESIPAYDANRRGQDADTGLPVVAGSEEGVSVDRINPADVELGRSQRHPHTAATMQTSRRLNSGGIGTGDRVHQIGKVGILEGNVVVGHDAQRVGGVGAIQLHAALYGLHGL